MKKRFMMLWLIVIAACMLALPASAGTVRAEGAREAEAKETALLSEYWTEGSEAASDMNEYLLAVTDETSPDYIPAEDRIAVFDLDGTLMCETYPFCFEYMVFADYALNHTDSLPAEVVAVAQEITDAAGGAKPSGMSTRQAAAAAIAYKGMTVEELREIVRKFKDSEAWGFSGMTRGEAYYRPMVELFEKLQANGFTVYIVTATERNIVREVISGTLDIPPSQVIGTEYGYTATNQGDAADADYTFQSSDSIVFDGNYYGENARTSKVDAIVREIGQQPVLAFGNSSGDLAMAVYTISGNPYRSAAYMVLADDETREYGNAESAAKNAASYLELGIGVFSMRDDFKTIYGGGVEKADEKNPPAEEDHNMEEIPVTDVGPVCIGQTENAEAATGCTVFIAPEGMRAGLDVRGGGPASRESQLLNPLMAAQQIHAIVLAGGSAYGLGAANGVMQYLEEHGIGYDTGYALVPLVAQSDIYDLSVGDSSVRPDAAMGYEAARIAMEAPNYQDGNYGAGCGATVGKYAGMDFCMKSGIGSYAIRIGELKIGAIVVVNALGDIYDWRTGTQIAGMLNEDRTGLRSTLEYMRGSYAVIGNKFTGNTTLCVVFTNAGFDKAQLCKIAGMAHDGYARSINPVHTSADGDSIYAVSIGDIEADQDLVGTLAAEVVSEAITRAVTNADGAYGYPAVRDLR